MDAENARLNAGKTTHPFFARKNARKKVSSVKTSLQSSEEVKTEEPSAVQVENDQPGAPIQATQLSEENARLNAGKTTHPFFARKKVSSVKTSLRSSEEVKTEEASAVQVENDQPGAPIQVTQLSEEAARLNAGKNTHPFFARKKTSSVKTAFQFEEASTFQVDDLQAGPPIHVTQLSSEDERPEMDWSEWILRSSNEDPKAEGRKLGRKRRRPLQPFEEGPDWDAVFNTFTVAINFVSSHLEEGNCNFQELVPSVEGLQGFLRHIQTSLSTSEGAEELARPSVASRALDAAKSVENLTERLSWYIARHELWNSADSVTPSQVSKEGDVEALPSNRNLLWTDLYQPRSSNEVCGNTAAVEILDTFLFKWQQKITGQPIREDGIKGVKGDGDFDYDSDQGWLVGDSGSDSDSGEIDDEARFHNTLLVTGPEGCGKSAAVYACAGERGFTVIEINASDCRNGALIKQKFGEAMESHGLGKGSQAGVDSPQPSRKRALTALENSPGQAKQNGAKQRKQFTEKKVVDGSPIKSQPMASQEGIQMDSQSSKRNTVILFEDVDKHFDEDKGFLAALVQLSKITKRPIILTSNKSAPGLPPALEKHRADFGYPSSEELFFHAGMVAIAERIPCSPWLLERLIVSCHNDLRKVMMALQFWGQGKAPLDQSSLTSRPAGLVGIPSGEEHNPLETNSKIGAIFDTSSGKGSLEQWQSDARWLFELDVHHFVLPKLIGGSFVCPLTLDVGEKISTAVRELEEHREYVAATKSEERARAIFLEWEALEPTRKAVKKEKAELRKASQSAGRALDDGAVIGLSPEENATTEHCDGEGWGCSPVKSLREAKTLARSPLKPKAAKSRRALLLVDSDDEEKQPQKGQKGIEPLGQTNSNIEPQSPALKRKIFSSRNKSADVVRDNLEDTDIIRSSISESLTKVRRRRLSKKNSTLETGMAKPKSLADFSSEVPKLKEPIPTDTVLSQSRPVIPEVVPLSQESDRPRQVVDDISTLITEPHTFMSGGCQPSSPHPEIGGQRSLESFDPNRENQIHETICSSGGEGLLEHDSNHTTAPERPALMGEGDDVNNSGRITAGPPGVSADVTISIDLDVEKAADQQSVAPVFEPLIDAWASLRASQQTSKSVLSHGETTANVISSLADLLDTISASDVIAFVEPEEYKDAWRNFDGAFSEAFEGNIGHSRDWDGCQEVASQLVCTGLQQSLPLLPTVNRGDYWLPVLSCISECAKDPPAVGRCIVTQAGLFKGIHQSSELRGMVDNVSTNASLTRQAERQGRLTDMVQAAVLPKGRVSRSGMIEYAGYLSRMSQLEEKRRTSRAIQGRRPRRFEHHLTSKLKALSSGDITDLLEYSSYKSS